jgi:peptidoglycan/LPS O-acetylase OafA/YrhL
LLALDALRGVAAIAVLFHHIEREFDVYFGFTYGYLAVDFFFLMSGFVIAGAYEPRMADGMSLGSFFLVRLKRLYPMIFLGSLLGIAAASISGTSVANPLWAGASALLMVPLMWSAPVLFPINIPEWSIFFEITTNLFHKVIYPLLSVRILFLLIAASIVGLGFAGWRLHGLANGWSPDTFWGGFPRTFLSYFAGVLIHRLTTRGRLSVPSLALPLLMVGFLAFVIFEAIIGRAVPPSLYWFLGVAVVLPTLLIFLIRSSVVPRFAATASALGDLSYPLYAIHVPLLTFVAPFVIHQTRVGRYASALVVAAVILLLALLLDRFYDRPIRKALTPRRLPRDQEIEAQITAP